MRALRDIISAPYAERVVAKYDSAGTYTVPLPAGKYRITVVGAGGGAATGGWKTNVGASSISGKWGYASGGGGAMTRGAYLLTESATAYITVGAHGNGSGTTRIYDEKPTVGVAVQMWGEGYSNVVLQYEARSHGGNDTNPATVIITNTESTNGNGGNGGVVGSSMDISWVLESGLNGVYGIVTEIADGTSTVIEGGAAGGGKVPAILGDAGKGGNATISYIDGTLTFSGGDGHDGAVLIERIG